MVHWITNRSYKILVINLNEYIIMFVQSVKIIKIKNEIRTINYDSNRLHCYLQPRYATFDGFYKAIYYTGVDQSVEGINIYLHNEFSFHHISLAISIKLTLYTKKLGELNLIGIPHELSI